MQKNKKRKGFTLTELAIVIAVIAILIAVLVPTFISLMDNAKESADKQLVNNLNTALSTDEAINGEAETMSEALAVADSVGYNVLNLSPTSDGYDIVWDQAENQFLLVENTAVIYPAEGTLETDNAYRYWYIVNSESDYTKYSANNCSLYINTELEEVESKGGVEYAEGVISTSTIVKATSSESSAASAENKALASVAIKAAGSTNIPQVIIVTNGGSLSVTVAGNADVKHSGSADDVTVENAKYFTANATVVSMTTNASITLTIGSEATFEKPIATKDDTVTLTVINTTSTTVYVVGNCTSQGGEVESYTETEYSAFIASVNGACYKKLTDAVNAASDGATVTLLKDYTSNTTNGSFYSVCGNLKKDVTINLNGYTLKCNSGCTLSGGLTSLTLKNGKYSSTSPTGSNAVFNIKTGASITMENMEVSAAGAILFPQGDASRVSVYNSTLNTTGSYCVATNAATVDNYNVIITIDNSTLTCGYTPICFNVPGSYSVTNSIIQSTSASPSVIIRGGTATIDNCKIYNNFTNYLDKAYVIWNARMDDWTKQDTSYTYGTAWGSGNATAYAVLCIGNDADSTSYQYATNCTVTNTEIHANKGYMCVYVEGNNKEANGATFNYSNCSFYYHGSVAPYNDTTGGTAYSNVTPTEYISSLYDSTNTTNPLNYAIIYTSDTASYVTINGTVYQDGV